MLGARLVVALVNQGDYIVLGLMASETVVGVYFFAFRLAAQPLQMLAGSFGNVLFPAFTQMSADPARQMDAALRASRILAYTVTPVCFLQAAVAEPLLHLMFGARWNAAVPLVQILSLGLPGDAVAWVAGALLAARGAFRRDLVLLAGFTPPFFLCAVLGAWWDGATGVAIGVSLYYALIKPINSWLVFRPAMGLRTFMQIFVTPLLLAGGAIGGAALVAAAPLLLPYPVLRIALVGTLGPLFYLAALRLAAPAILREVIGQLPVGRMGPLGRALSRA